MTAVATASPPATADERGGRRLARARAPQRHERHREREQVGHDEERLVARGRGQWAPRGAERSPEGEAAEPREREQRGPLREARDARGEHHGDEQREQQRVGQPVARRGSSRPRATQSRRPAGRRARWGRRGRATLSRPPKPGSRGPRRRSRRSSSSSQPPIVPANRQGVKSGGKSLRCEQGQQGQLRERRLHGEVSTGGDRPRGDRAGRRFARQPPRRRPRFTGITRTMAGSTAATRSPICRQHSRARPFRATEGRPSFLE